MDTKFKQIRKATRLASVAMILLLAFTAIALAQGGRYQVDPWSFGVHGDTQWYVSGNFNDENPNWVSAGIAGAINEQFIAYKNTGKYDVKFVLQVGDLTDRAGDAAMYTRADVASSLYNEGIGFFPLRGNHESYGYLYGLDPDYNLNIPAYLDAFPQTQGMYAADGLNEDNFGAINFSSPNVYDEDGNLILNTFTGDPILKGLSYSFDFGDTGNNARFLIADVESTEYVVTTAPVHPVYGQGYFYFGFWVVYQHTEELTGREGNLIEPGTWFRITGGQPSTQFYGFDVNWPVEVYKVLNKYDPSGTEYWPGMQQGWISGQLDETTRNTEHAFVFSHRPLMGADHVDGLFGANPSVTPDDQNDFYASLADNGVKYMISGHDHIYNRALVDSPDGLSQVEQLISIGASNKFYDPGPLDDFGDVKQRETIISQETWTVGYYVYTVDGPRVTVDYYSDSQGFEYDADNYPYGPDGIPGPGETPDFDFVKKETWGYSHNGQQFLIAQGDSYTDVEDRFYGTTARILAGTNNSTTTDDTPENSDGSGGPRALNKTVNTGWVENPDAYKLKSDILSLWGMSELGAEGQTDTYVLSMSFDFRRMVHLGNGGIGIATYVGGEWVNAVDENFGGKKKFVVGKYKPGYGLGTYGIDPSTKTAWAVLNYNADFAVAMDIESVPGQMKKQNKNGK